MAQLFRTAVLGLSKQLITATGNNLYVNGLLVGSGVYATIDALTQTGQALYSDFAALSGNLITSGSLLSAVKVTGSAILPLANLTGLGGTQVFASGSYIVISGVSPGGGTVASINGLGGAVVVVGTGGLTITVQGQNVVVSGDSSISGALTQTGVSILAALAATGLQDFQHYTGLSGALGQTGAAIEAQINALSGTVGAMSGALQTSINGVTTSLALSGSNLYITVTGLSGQSVVNLGSTGNALYQDILGLSGLLSSVKVTGSSIIPLVNITGLGGTLVFTSGGFLFVSGAGEGSSAGVSSLNGLTNAVTVVGTGLITVSVAGQSVVISGDTSISGALTATGVALGAQNASLSGYADQFLVHRMGAELVSGNKTFTVTSSGTRFENPLSIQSYVELAALGVTGYLSAMGNQFFRVNNQTGAGDFLAAVVKNIGPGQQGLNDGTSLVVRGYSGNSVGDPFPYDIFVGCNTGFGYGFIDVAHEGIGFIPLVLCPSAKDNDRVGVLNTNPLEKLDVSGNIRVSNGVFKSGAADISTLYAPYYKPQMSVVFNSASVTWTSMPAAANYFNATALYTSFLDLTQYTGVQLVVSKLATAGAATGALFLRYSSNPAQTFSNFLDIDTGPSRTMINVASVMVNSGFFPLVAGAKSGVYIALCGSGGSAAVNPVFGMVTANFK